MGMDMLPGAARTYGQCYYQRIGCSWETDSDMQHDGDAASHWLETRVISWQGFTRSL